MTNKQIDDVIINKISIIERCLKRVDEEYIDNKLEFKTNFTKQDSIILNLQRACEASIDLALYIIRKKRLGIVQTSKESFQLLAKANIISEQLSNTLQKMTGFRNIAVHDYQRVSLDIVESVINDNRQDFLDYIQSLLKNFSDL